MIRLFTAAGGAEGLRAVNKTPRVVFWHGADRIVNPEAEAECIDIDVFQKQIEYLVTRFDIISPDAFYRKYTENSFSGREMLLTFDGGYKNNLTRIAPVLRNYSLPFLVFISPNVVTENKLLPVSVSRLILTGSRLKYISIPEIGFSCSLGSMRERIQAVNSFGKILKKLPED